MRRSSQALPARVPTVRQGQPCLSTTSQRTRPSILIRMTGQPSWPIAGRAPDGYSPSGLFEPRDSSSLVLLPAALTLASPTAVRLWTLTVIIAQPAPALVVGGA